jgi:predicted homoserine dehydrogenase-like protein
MNESSAPEVPGIGRVGVIGAGQIGKGIAHVGAAVLKGALQ